MKRSTSGPMPSAATTSAFLLKARERYGYDEWFFWLTLFRTGVRIGEGCALELADFKVDDAKPVLHVHQTMSTGVGLHLQRKNVDDVTVHLRIWPSYLDEARRFLRHRRQQKQQRELVTPWTFANERGQPWPYATLHGHFQAILRAAELPHHTPHDTRHTFAVNVLDWTHDIDYVAQMLGDSLTVVVATYLKHQGARDKSEQYAGIGTSARARAARERCAASDDSTRLHASWTQPRPR